MTARPSPVVVALPPVPTRRLITQNRRMGWRQRAALTRRLRRLGSLAWASARASGALPLTRARVDITVLWPDRRRRDAENIAPSVKAILDGIITGPPPVGGARPDREWVGVLPDDSSDYLTSITYRISHDLCLTPRHAIIQIVFIPEKGNR